jgi:molybdopterin molybdotransferase
MAREHRPRSTRWVDVRLCGFPERASAAQAVAWIDAHPALGAEPIAAGEACGRILHAPLAAGADLPAYDRAADDGYAVRSRETIGAGAYNPIALTIQAADAPLAMSSAALVNAGAPLPQGADAVLPFWAANRAGALVEALAGVAEGAGVERRGQELQSGAPVYDAARELRAHDVAILTAIGVGRVEVVRRPRVRIVVAGPKRSDGPPPPDVNGPMLRALVARDGGDADTTHLLPADELAGAMARSLLAPGADAILVTGRTGTGADDEAPLALADAGELAIHGIALRPGGSAGMGRVGSIPVILLPGAPLACLCAYELLAGRLIRRLGSRDPRLPHAVQQSEVRRKIVSAIGLVDVCQVRLVGGGLEPIGSAEDGGLASALHADGFVVVPAPLEGHAPGARVEVHLYRALRARDEARESWR